MDSEQLGALRNLDQNVSTWLRKKTILGIADQSFWIFSLGLSGSHILF